MRENIYRRFSTPYIDAQNLLCLLQGYSNPRAWIAREVSKGNLIRLKDGFFLRSEETRTEDLQGQIGNLLYGPSYVSLHWALSFYGLIPERTYMVTSVTTRRDKEYRTPIGSYTYRYLREDRYAIGVTQMNGDQRRRFLIATPEKAFIDFIHFQCEELEQKSLAEEVLESHRFEEEDLRNLDFNRLSRIGEVYRSKKIRTLLKWMRRL